jgi:hypothetical protein
MNSATIEMTDDYRATQQVEFLPGEIVCPK